MCESVCVCVTSLVSSLFAATAFQELNSAIFLLPQGHFFSPVPFFPKQQERILSLAVCACVLYLVLDRRLGCCLAPKAMKHWY